MKHKLSPRISASLLSFAILFALVTPIDARVPTASEPPAIRITPPAPAVTDADMLRELATRRGRVAEKVGRDNALVLFSAAPRVYTGDVDYEYRQENNFFYLTNLRQQDARLVLVPGAAGVTELLFLPRRNPAAETWTGRMYAPEEAARLSGIQDIWAAEEFEPFMRALAANTAYTPKADGVLMRSTPTSSAANTPAASSTPVASTPPKKIAALFILAPFGERREDTREWIQEARFANSWEKMSPTIPVRPAWMIFAELRMRKSPLEIGMLQHAVDITIEGLGRAMASANRLKWEYEAEAEVEYTFKRRGADYWGYPSIVGCGMNGTTLHYWESLGRITPGSLLLMDMGAEYKHYTADVTRTFPVNGRFTPAQADIYNAVLAAQDAAFAAIKTGGTLAEVHAASTAKIKEGLLRLGLITDPNSNQHRLWFMHGTSHWLGMNVHDVGVPGARLEPGVVFTVEPGIYIREDALDYLPKTPENEAFIKAVRPAFEKYKNIGVRIEDDVVMTEGGYRVMTEKLPRTIPDIEAFIARSSRELSISRNFAPLAEMSDVRVANAEFRIR